MKNAIIFLFFALCYNAFGQRYIDSTLTKDFNSDGIVDTLHYFEEYGSGFGGTDYKITNGKTKEFFELSNYSSYGSTKKLIPIPPALFKKENKGFLDTVKKGLLPPQKKNSPDSSLQWIIDATYNCHTTDDNSYFEKVFTPNSAWKAAAYEPPSDYYLEVWGDSVLRLADQYVLEKIDSTNTRNLSAFLLYSGKAIRDWDIRVDHEGNSEDGYIPVVSNKTYSIYKTKHAILAKKELTHKWLFVTDDNITNAPQKLRWPSIDKIILKGDYLIFKHDLPPGPEYNVYVIHIESGNCGRLNVDFDEILKEEIFIADLSEEEALSIKKDTINIGRGQRSLQLPFDEVKQQLRDFSKRE